MDQQQQQNTKPITSHIVASDAVVYDVATMMDHNAINKLQNMQTEMY